MRTYIIIIFTLKYSVSLYSQTKTEPNKGQVYKIQGLITEKATKDTLHLVTVEFLNKDYKWIKATRSDFDGIYFPTICSNELINDTLVIKTTQVLYNQEFFHYKINSDSSINISMILDQNQSISKEQFNRHNQNFQNSNRCCLIEEDIDEIEYQKNKRTYRHYCSGEKRKYRNLVDSNQDFSKWILIKKYK